MRRTLLLATLMLGALAAVPSMASAALTGPPYFGLTNSGSVGYTVLDANNTPATVGPKVGFFVNFSCTAGEGAAFGAYATLSSASGPANNPQGSPDGGGATPVLGCRGGLNDFQDAFLIVQDKQGSFDATSNPDLEVRGFGFTGTTGGQLTDLQPDTETLPHA